MSNDDPTVAGPNDPTFATTPAIDATGHGPPAGGLRAGAEIADYRLVRKLGEGGMGDVWLAEQLRPVRRSVAIKLIRRGLSGAEVLRRFEAERQALALMNHPNIARVLDAGETADGHPYFVMEYVEGVSLTAHCEAKGLPLRERLELFQQVCDGVQHAHQKGIIHRDLKPSNVIVAVQGGKAVPKIIDFGIATAVEQPLSERTLLTEVGQLIGTPEYMSPEQAAFTSEGIDTRTDVYALGVLLYELLVGARPLEGAELRKLAFDEILRRIREHEPAKPSTRLGPRGRELRGDLDWITMKAIEKDRERRYGSAAEFSADVGRYLHHEPVTATPPSLVYRMGKFTRRHRVAVAVTTATFVGLAAFAGVTLVQARRIAAERDRANQAAETSRKMSELLIGLFRVADPGESRGRTVTAREILDRAAERVQTELVDRPSQQAALLTSIGSIYSNLGLLDSAEPLFDRALAVNPMANDLDRRQRLLTEGALAWLRQVQGRLAEAESLDLAVLAGTRREFGPDHPYQLTIMNNLSLVYDSQGRAAEAESLRLATLDAQRRILGAESLEALRSQNNLGFLYLRQGRGIEAETLLVRTAEAQKRTLGPDHPETIRSLSNLSLVYDELGRHAASESLRLVSIASYERVLGPDHFETLRTKGSLAYHHMEMEQWTAAESLLHVVLEGRTRTLGAAHLNTIDTRVYLAATIGALGRQAEAERELATILAGRLATMAPDSPPVMRVRVQQAYLGWRMGKPDAARRSLELADALVARFGAANEVTTEFCRSAATLARHAGDEATAIALQQRMHGSVAAR